MSVSVTEGQAARAGRGLVMDDGRKKERVEILARALPTMHSTVAARGQGGWFLLVVVVVVVVSSSCCVVDSFRLVACAQAWVVG